MDSNQTFSRVPGSDSGITITGLKSMVETPAVSVLTTARELVGGDRAVQHGDKSDNFNAIAVVWNGLLKAAGAAPARPLDAHDVCNMMEAMKIARRYTGATNKDDYVDGAGYAACAFEVKAGVKK